MDFLASSIGFLFSSEFIIVLLVSRIDPSILLLGYDVLTLPVSAVFFGKSFTVASSSKTFISGLSPSKLVDSTRTGQGELSVVESKLLLGVVAEDEDKFDEGDGYSSGTDESVLVARCGGPNFLVGKNLR